MNSTPATVSVALALVIILSTESVTGFSDCGGEQRGDTGIITSPRYPTDYPNDAECSWTIIADPKKIIDLRFSKIDLDGYGNSCPDYINVYDGDSPRATLITKLCRQKTSSELQAIKIRSTGNKIHITFTSNGFNTGKGFQANYWTHVCPALKYGTDLCSTSCTCVAKNTASCNNVNGKCACKPGWSGTTCSTDIKECSNTAYERCPDYQECVETQGSFACKCKDGLVKDAKGQCKAKTLCDPNPCSHLCSVMTTKKKSSKKTCFCPHSTIIGADTLKCTECPAKKYGRDCLRTCKACASGRGKCNPTNGDCLCNAGWTSADCSADCSQDVNECTDTNIARVCTNVGRVCVNTLGSYRCECARGFELEASTNKCVAIDCTKRIDPATTQTIQTHYFPATYWPNALCSWTIVTTDTQSIALSAINLPNDGSGDYIEVYDGENPRAAVLGVYYQEKPPISTIRSTGNMMHVVFRSNGHYEIGSFNGNLNADSYPTCKQTMAVDQTRQAIKNPGHPAGYSKNTFCYWLVTRNFGNTISLRKKTLDVDPTGNSFLAVYDGPHAGARLIGKFFGTSMPSLIRTSGTSLYIVFQSDGSNVGTGFEVNVHAQNCPAFYYGLEECNIPCKCVQPNSYSCDNMYGVCSCRPGWRSSDCSEDINECKESPSICTETERCVNTPGSYHCQPDCDQDFTKDGPISTKAYSTIPLNRARCNFNIAGKTGDVVSVKMDDFQLLESDDCFMDSLEIYNNPVVTNKLIGKYCGTRLPEIIRSTDRTMLLKLSTYNGSSRRGFRGQIYIHKCSPFTWGNTCQYSCTCNQKNTEFCDNTNGVCVCRTGMRGDDCNDDVNECLFSKCSENEVCANSPGSFSCICKKGFAKIDNGPCSGVKTSCTTAIKDLCSHSCYHDGDSDVCGCPDGLELGTTENTKYQCILPYYPYGIPADDLELSTLSDKNGSDSGHIKFTSYFPFGSGVENEVLKADAYVFNNGLISFGNKAIPQEPSLQVVKNNKQDLVSAFWAKIDPTTGQTFYHLYEKCDQSVFNALYNASASDESDFSASDSGANSTYKDDVMERAAKDVIKFTNCFDFDVNTVLVVTWQDVKPADKPDAPGNTFQAVLISGNKQERSSDEGFSDEETAYVLFIYQKGQMRWPAKDGRQIEIGYVASPYTSFNSVPVQNKEFNFQKANYLESVMLEVSKYSSLKQKCQRHVCKNSPLITSPEYQSEMAELYNCPCTVGQLGLQWSLFERRGDNIYCYAISPVAKRNLLGSNPRNKLCCYLWNQPPEGSGWESWQASIDVSSFVHNTVDAGHILVGDSVLFKGVQENLDAHQWCCKGAQDSELCNRFNAIYPDMDCSYNVTFVPANLLGDPHIITFDNKTYTVNILGEYILMDVPSMSFTLQARTSQVKTSKGVLTNATVFSAFAAKEGDHARFQVELSSDKKSMVILVDGVSYTADFYKSTTFRLTKEYIDIFRDNRFNKTKVGALFPSNVIVEVNVGVDCLELNMEVDKSIRGKTKGLLGNFNGRADDDFLLPNGTVLPANMTEEQIYRNFANKYQVTANTSVFIYSNGMTAANYTKADFIPVFRSSLNISAALLKNATTFCGVGSELCIYDYLVTGDTRFAQNTKSTQALSISSRLTLENTIPSLEVDETSAQFINQRWLVQEGVVNTLRFTATDKDGDSLTYLLSGNPKRVTVNDSGILTYTPNSLEPVKIGVRVKDSRNGYSPFLYLPIVICPGCNNHGTCNLDSSRTSTKNDGLVQILKCACIPAYTGDSCESEKDACKYKPCSTGQNCTDLTAAQQGNSSVGHVCGPCPAGFEDVKGSCIDKDECVDTNICDQICTNTEGSYRCSCNDGFLLNTSDSKSCFAKNCSNRCVSENTRYCNESISQCVCKAGIITNDCSVLVIDSCLSNPCPNNLLCKQKGNTYDCVCRNGLPMKPGNYCIDCNRTLTEASGKLMSTNYPENYPENLYCAWTIVSREATAVITLNISDFDVEGCPFDYLEVFDGNSSKSNMIGQYCEEVPENIVSSGNALHVVFISDSSVNLRGFIASYVAETQCRIKKCSHSCQVVSANPRVETCVCPLWTRIDPRNDSQCLEINSCNTTITTSSGYIVSPGYPQKYAANLTCSWYIQVSTASNITLSFSDLDMEIVGSSCAYDSLAVYSGNSAGGTQLGKFCGTLIPQNVTSSTRTGIYVVFKSDGTFFGRGFKAQFNVR
ncbi:unnamed protein product [Lymnaea stagnalis]|uniref:Cubilin n=1 Tax=Lymnaea stagnalis TaxID=6523 RepID=A0AAV2IL30_LYMST